MPGHDDGVVAEDASDFRCSGRDVAALVASGSSLAILVDADPLADVAEEAAGKFPAFVSMLMRLMLCLVDAEDAADVAELAALEADVDASDALVVAVVADELADVADDAAAVAELAALVADVVAVAASTIKSYFAELALEVNGCDPEDV